MKRVYAAKNNANPREQAAKETLKSLFGND